MKIPKVVDVQTIVDARGRIGVVQQGDIPFQMKRVYFIYGGQSVVRRGEHAHRHLEQLIVALTSEVAVSLDDGLGGSMQFTLLDPSKALYIPPMYWRTLKLSPKAVCLVLASDVYDEGDYIRDYEEYCRCQQSHLLT